jgi:hypothetical protein
MSARAYIKRRVTEVKHTLAEVNQGLKTKVTAPIGNKYLAELNATPKLDSEQLAYFQGLIGILWCIC